SGTTLRIRPPQGHYPGDAGNSVQWNEPNWLARNVRKDTPLFGLVGTLEEVKPTYFGEASWSDLERRYGTYSEQRHVDLPFPPVRVVARSTGIGGPWTAYRDTENNFIFN